MTKTLFIASAEPYSGKSVIRLGLINMLLGKAQRVGYFKPILDTDPKEKRDINLLTVIEHFNPETARTLVNQVRVRSNATPLGSITLNDILDELGRELMWEGTRSRDMIRFGTFFTWTPFFKPAVTPAFRGLLPIQRQN